LNELEERGLLLRDVGSTKYDLHPIVRRYCYEERLLDKKSIHSQLRDYFATVPKPEKIESLDDLAPVIELYHHTVNSGRYNEACDLYFERLSDQLYYDFGAYEECIKLGSALFHDGLDHLPQLKKDTDKAYYLNHLANSYSLSGQPKKAVLLLEMANEIDKKRGHKKGVAIGLGNLALDHIRLGELKSAESNLRSAIKLYKEIDAKYEQVQESANYGLLFSYNGKYKESAKHLDESYKLANEVGTDQQKSLIWAYRALRALFMSNPEEVLRAAKRARELADVEKVERDIIRAEWLLGAGYLAKSDLKVAEQHLNEALVRDRRISMVDIEPDILLELAKLRFEQRHKEEALKLANEALEIADRCEYRLAQADIHNFLAEFYYKTENFSKAKEHVKIAKERAECGYVPAMKKAEELEKRISQQLKLDSQQINQIKRMKRSTD